MLDLVPGMELPERRKIRGFPRHSASGELLTASSVSVHPYWPSVCPRLPKCQATNVVSRVYAGQRGHATHNTRAAVIFRREETCCRRSKGELCQQCKPDDASRALDAVT